MRYHQFLRNTTYLRYAIFFATMFFAVYGVQAYINRQNMLGSIEDVKDEIVEVQEETDFLKNFKRPYLDSERAPYYLGHENGVLYDGEYVVRLRYRKPLVEDDGDSVPDDILLMQEPKDSIVISSPQESWHYFINDKLQPLKDLGLLE